MSIFDAPYYKEIKIERVRNRIKRDVLNAYYQFGYRYKRKEARKDITKNGRRNAADAKQNEVKLVENQEFLFVCRRHRTYCAYFSFLLRRFMLMSCVYMRKTCSCAVSFHLCIRHKISCCAYGMFLLSSFFANFVQFYHSLLS